MKGILMRKVKVEFEVSVPDGVTPAQVEKWVRFEVGAQGHIMAENPLVDTDLDASKVVVRQ